MLETEQRSHYFIALLQKCQVIVETLALVDTAALLRKLDQQAKNWEAQELNAENSATHLRMLILAARDCHPLPARLDRQLAGIEENSELAASLRKIAEILPNKLVEQHLEIVRKAAGKYHIPSRLENEAEFQDLQSVGREALFVAAQKFFRNPHGSFKSFAWPFIREAMRAEQSRRHPVPFKIRKKLAALSRLRETAHLTDVHLTREEIQQKLKLGSEELREVLAIESIWGNGMEFETDVDLDEIEAPDHGMNQLSLLLEVEDQFRLDEALQRIDGVEKILIAKLYFEDKTYREVAEEMQLTLPSFKKLHKKALAAMKKQLHE